MASTEGDLDLEQSPSYQLWLATNAWQRLVRKRLEPLGLTHVQFVVLASVRRHCCAENCLTQAKICRIAELDENMGSQVIRNLEKRGLLRRVEHPSDKRAHQIELTLEGESLADQARRIAKETSKEFFAPLADQEALFVELLRRLHSSSSRD